MNQNTLFSKYKQEERTAKNRDAFIRGFVAGQQKHNISAEEALVKVNSMYKRFEGNKV